MTPQGPLEICRECGGGRPIQVGLFPTLLRNGARLSGMGRIRRNLFYCEGTNGESGKRCYLSPSHPVSDGCGFTWQGRRKGLNGGSRGISSSPWRLKTPYFRKRGEDLYVEVPLTVWKRPWEPA